MTFATKKYIIILIFYTISNERQKIGTEMKKIISLLLALTCVFALFSCEEEKKVSELEEFVNVVSSSAPTKITTIYSYSDSVNGNTLAGNFETVIYGDDFHMNYTYQSYAVPGPDADPKNPIINNAGTVYYKDGQYSTDKETWFTVAPNELTLQIKLELTEESLKKYTLDEEKTTLTANVSSAQAKKILGVDLGATEDGVDIQISHDGTYIREIVVTYATENSDIVTYQTRYLYEPQVSPWDAE